jgi:hypothetical protein
MSDMTVKKFKEAWNNAKVLGDIDKCLAFLTSEEKRILLMAMDTAKTYLGDFDARDECLYGALKYEVGKEAGA